MKTRIESKDAWGAGWDELDKTKFYSSLLFSSLCIRTVLYPISVAKTRVQQLGGDMASRGTISIVRHVAQTEGVTRLYRGFTLATTTGFLTGPLFVTVMERARKFYTEGPFYFPRSHAASAAAATGTCVSQLLFVPMDNVTQRLMVNRKLAKPAAALPPEASTTTMTVKPPTTTSEQIKTLWQVGGLRAFYRGFGPSLMLFVPTSMIFWPTYTKLRSASLAQIGATFSEDSVAAQALTALIAPLCSSIAGAFAMATTTPMDAIKTRMQLTDASRRVTVTQVIRDIHAKEGFFKGFTLGVRMRVSCGMVMYPMVVTSYETIKWYSKCPAPTESEQQTADALHEECVLAA